MEDILRRISISLDSIATSLEVIAKSSRKEIEAMDITNKHLDNIDSRLCDIKNQIR